LLLSSVFFLSLRVIVSLLLLVLDVFPRNPDLSNFELSPLLPALSASVRKSIGDKNLWMVSNPFSGFDAYSHFEKSVFLLECLGRVCLLFRQQLGGKELVTERAFF